jgi:hypothetical protein
MTFFFITDLSSQARQIMISIGENLLINVGNKIQILK